MGADPDTENAKAVLRWIQREQVSRFTQREVQHALKSRFRKAEEVARALAVLVDMMLIRERPRQVVAHRPSRDFDVNPHVLA